MIGFVGAIGGVLLSAAAMIPGCEPPNSETSESCASQGKVLAEDNTCVPSSFYEPVPADPNRVIVVWESVGIGRWDGVGRLDMWMDETIPEQRRRCLDRGGEPRAEQGFILCVGIDAMIFWENPPN